MLISVLFSACAPVATPAAARVALAGTATLLQFTSAGHALSFSPQGMYAATGSHALHVDFVGVNNAQPQADSPANGEANAAPLGRVTYTDLWDGVSLTYSAAAAGIYTSTYSLAPGADTNQIRLRYNAPLTLNKNGTLNITFQTGALTESAPIAWQDIQGRHVPVQAAFLVEGQELGFALGAYDARQPLTIDPTLTWNTFLGGDGDDRGTSIAVDGKQNVYVAGTSSAAWGSPVRAYTADRDAFVAKLDSSGNLQWNTFLGGDGDDRGNAITVDASGSVYVAGDSFATWDSPVRPYKQNYDAFAARLDASSGNLGWNTFLGGDGGDFGYSITVDVSGNVYVAGDSFATWGSPLRPYKEGADIFAAKLDPSGNLGWNTFLGGSGTDEGSSIAVDNNKNVYVAGSSFATWGNPIRAYTAGFDAFAAKLDPSGNLGWNTFLGGGEADWGYGIAVDGSGNVYVAGTSMDTWGSPLRAYTAGPYSGGFDAFAARLDSSGNLDWNTFLGGSGTDEGNSIAVDDNKNVYVAGDSFATWGSPLRAYSAGNDAFAATLDSSGNLGLMTFLGGSGDEEIPSIAADGSGNVYMAGTSSATWDSPLRAYSAGDEAFVAKLDFAPITLSILRGDFNPTTAANVYFTLRFDESVTGVDMTDFKLTTSGVTGASVTGVDGSNSTYIVQVATGSGNGTIRLDLNDDDSIVGPDVRPLGGFGAGNGDFKTGDVYTVYKTPPSVSSIIRANPNPTNAVSVNFTVSFSKPVSSVDASDFSLTAIGPTGASITSVSGSGAIYGVTVNTGTGNGTIRLDLPNTATITDLDGNLLTSLPFTTGEVYTINKTVTLTLNSTSAPDGWMLESSETSNVGGSLNTAATTFLLGDSAGDKQYRSILSFNTASIPDNATITGVTIKIKRPIAGFLTGNNNPFTWGLGLKADVCKNFFGATSALQLSDFNYTNAANCQMLAATFGGAPSANWYSANVLSSAFVKVNKLGLTQFRLRFVKDDNDDGLADYLSFYSGNAAAADRPQLIVHYSVP
jgi:hypothetical protein